MALVLSGTGVAATFLPVQGCTYKLFFDEVADKWWLQDTANFQDLIGVFDLCLVVWGCRSMFGLHDCICLLLAVVFSSKNIWLQELVALPNPPHGEEWDLEQHDAGMAVSSDTEQNWFCFKLQILSYSILAHLFCTATCIVRCQNCNLR